MAKRRKKPAKRGRAKREVSAGGVVFRRVAGEPLRYLLIKDSYGHWGLPKGHIESRESAEQAAIRETTEETGLTDLKAQAPITTIDWYFRLRGTLIHKYCHFFLIESSAGEPVPQLDEGITECVWLEFDRALEQLDYANARDVLRQAGEMAQALVS